VKFLNFKDEIHQSGSELEEAIESVKQLSEIMEIVLNINNIFTDDIIPAIENNNETEKRKAVFLFDVRKLIALIGGLPDYWNHLSRWVGFTHVLPHDMKIWLCFCDLTTL